MGKNVYNALVCCCGSVAAVKIPRLCTILARKECLQVKLVVTKGGRHFLDNRRGDNGMCPAERYDPEAWKDFREDIEKGRVTELYDEDDWKNWSELGDPILHIDVRSRRHDCFYFCSNTTSEPTFNPLDDLTHKM